MAFIVALLVLFGALSIFNIVLTVGLVRRVRELSTKQRAPMPPRADLPPVMRAEGERVEPFRAVTVREEPVSEDFLAVGPVLLGVFAYGCTSCHERIPEFLSFVAAQDYRRDQVLVILVGKTADFTEELPLLDPIATVVVERRQGPVARALGVKAYPALAVIGAGGVVRAAGAGMNSLTPVHESA
ncbi:hypothetical protein RB625_33670 [Streptomyces californicus]|uniref:TlpA family protein disulfide reductase n=1 Tax=Streptomyces californicus TaxID=67351 RepID=UPI00296F1C28|nr:hypothetical protein [Streptomyces californicus]MDW4903361.1 hypothetical protein [Streptomyces californicus]